MIARQITFFGQACVVACDANCAKAWGINARPHIDFDPTDPDDYAFLADGELGEAPVDPGTYEGGDAKPQHPKDRLNRWCVRQCERCEKSRVGKPDQIIETHDWTKRVHNQPWKRTPTPALRGRPSSEVSA